jgi:hypothetical protein
MLDLNVLEAAYEARQRGRQHQRLPTPVCVDVLHKGFGNGVKFDTFRCCRARWGGGVPQPCQNCPDFVLPRFYL